MVRDEKTQAIVIDNGSGVCKAGFAGDDVPFTVFPCVVGRMKHTGVMVGRKEKDFYFGDEALSRQGILTLRYPIEHGFITNWDEMVAIWDYIFYDKLCVDPAEHRVLITDAPMSQKCHRKRMIEVMFERFKVPAISLATHAVLSLYSVGRTTGIVLDSGDGVTNTVPIYDGCILDYASERLNLAGRDLSKYMRKLMMDRLSWGYTTAELEIFRDMKEKACYVAENFDLEMMATAKNTSNMITYELPDGQVITIENERFLCPEALFQPKLLGLDCPSLSELVYESIMKCDISTRRDLYANVLLSGGSTMFRGFDKRLSIELEALSPSTVEVNVVAPPERKYAVWIGGSIQASLTAFQSMWATKEQYEECGLNVVHRLCF
ncbi:Actin alpha anomalous [Fasciola hepatica]|uniref:Actin alpha anomalous n=1 Tax=Fasciola hepatica TaxID=6192 RepID=A0A2H1CU73_FASHE|nr:Actin alpha anomalous [Fasciola hepatica]